MKRIALIIIVFIPIITFCQETNIFFVSGIPFDFEKCMPKPPIIYQYNNQKQLDTISIITCKKNSEIKLLNVYTEFHLLVMYESLFGKDGYKYLSLIDLTKPKDIEVEQIIYPEESIESNLFILENGDNYYCLDFIGKKFIGISRDLKKKDFSPNDFNSSYIAGETGGAIKNVDFLLLYKDINDNKLHISKGFGLKTGPLFNIQPPDSMIYKIKGLVTALVNNKNVLVVWVDESDPSNAELGFSSLIIYDKNNRLWYSYKVPGNYLTMKGFGEWLTGEVTAKNIGSFIKSKGTYSPYNFGKIHPGIEKRKKPTEIWGEVFDNRAETLGNYYPGILYVLNAHTQKYIEWNTGQGDSEIILLQDGIIYYRINDEIYKRPIIEGKELGPEELLIKDPRVPDIHWAFLSQGN